MVSSINLMRFVLLLFYLGGTVRCNYRKIYTLIKEGEEKIHINNITKDRFSGLLSENNPYQTQRRVILHFHEIDKGNLLASSLSMGFCDFMLE